MTNINEIQTCVASWVQEGLATFTPSGFLTVHIDQLFPVKPEDGLQLSIIAYKCLIEIIRNSDQLAKPMLVIPLITVGSELSMSAPTDLNMLKWEHDQHEPPSLYLIDWQNDKSVAPCEEYIRPLPFNILDDSISVYGYYREFRYQIALNNNWEFTRAVYFEYYPNGLTSQ